MGIDWLFYGTYTNRAQSRAVLAELWRDANQPGLILSGRRLVPIYLDVISRK